MKRTKTKRKEFLVCLGWGVNVGIKDSGVLKTSSLLGEEVKIQQQELVEKTNKLILNIKQLERSTTICVGDLGLESY